MTTALDPELSYGVSFTDLWVAAAAQEKRQQASIARDNEVYAVQITAKAARDKKTYAEFRTRDAELWQQSRERAVKANLAAAEQEARNCCEYVPECEAVASEALAMFRSAEDRAAQAAEAARLAQEAHTMIKDAGTPEEIRTALRDSKDATEVLADFMTALETARASREEADDQLAEARADHREAQAQADKALDNAKRNAKAPLGDAPISSATIRANYLWMRQPAVWNTLEPADQQRVRTAMTNNGGM